MPISTRIDRRGLYQFDPSDLSAWCAPLYGTCVKLARTGDSAALPGDLSSIHHLLTNPVFGYAPISNSPFD